MKAVVYTRYGLPEVLRLVDVPTPTPKGNEVLVRARAVSLNASDWEALRGKPLYARVVGPFRPRHRVLGSDIAGRVEAVGREATLFRPGDDVFADIFDYMGGFAEYVCVPESALARMPSGMTYEEAAAIPQAGAIALQGIRGRGRVQPGQKEVRSTWRRSSSSARPGRSRRSSTVGTRCVRYPKRCGISAKGTPKERSS